MKLFLVSIKVIQSLKKMKQVFCLKESFLHSNQLFLKKMISNKSINSNKLLCFNISDETNRNNNHKNNNATNNNKAIEIS